mmetsp:Transcript_35407/g.85417  ORF Transcript_35407/g.85417 Transcript_35407/m.85417 type:complete len:243 (-) Transcript_35407:370-1098(-)
MRARFVGFDSLLRHERDVFVLWERQGHPEVWISIELPVLCLELRLELLTECLQNLGADRKAAQTRPHPRDIPQVLQHPHGRGVIDLLHLRRIRARPVANGDDAVLFQSLFLPNLLRGGLLLEGAHDVDVVGGRVDEGRGGDEDLIAPEDGETAGAGGGVNARLADDGLEDGDGFVGAIGQRVAYREFHTRLIVVLTRRQRSQPRPLPGSMIQRRRNLPTFQLLGQIHIVLLPCDATRLLKGV